MSLFAWSREEGQPQPSEQLERTVVPRVVELTEPQGLLVSVDDLANEIKVTAGDEAPMLQSLIESCTRCCEAHCGRSFLERDLALWLDFCPPSKVIELVKGPVSEITSMFTYTEDGTETEYSTSLYVGDVVSSPARVALKNSSTWPTTLRNVNALKVLYTAGYGTIDDVPENIKRAIAQLASEVYLARGRAVDAREFTPTSVCSQDVLMLLEPYRIIR